MQQQWNPEAANLFASSAATTALIQKQQDSIGMTLCYGPPKPPPPTWRSIALELLELLGYILVIPCFYAFSAVFSCARSLFNYIKLLPMMIGGHFQQFCRRCKKKKVHVLPLYKCDEYGPTRNKNRKVSGRRWGQPPETSNCDCERITRNNISEVDAQIRKLALALRDLSQETIPNPFWGIAEVANKPLEHWKYGPVTPDSPPLHFEKFQHPNWFVRFYGLCTRVFWWLWWTSWRSLGVKLCHNLHHSYFWYRLKQAWRGQEQHGRASFAKEQSILTPPSVTKQYASIVGREFLHMLKTGDGRAQVTPLVGGKSEPGNRLQKYPAGIKDFLNNMPKDHYIQQEALDDLKFPKETDQWKVQRIHQAFLNNLQAWIHPSYREQELAELHGPQLFAGPENIKVSLHFDRYFTNDSSTSYENDPGRHNLFWQLTGRKKWILFPPIVGDEEEKTIFQPMTDQFSSHVSSIQTLAVEEEGKSLLQDKFPQFVERVWDERMEVILEGGDVLHLPPRWWHTTESLEPGIAVNWWFSFANE